MPNYYTLLTPAGLAKVTNAQLTNQKVEISQVAVGDASGTPYQPTGNETALKREVWRGGVLSTALDTQNPNWIVVESVIPATVGGFSIREVGLFDVEGTLIAIGNYPDTYKPLVSDGSTMDLALRTIIEVSNASSVTLRIDPNVIVASRKFVTDQVDAIKKQTEQLILDPALFRQPQDLDDTQSFELILLHAKANNIKSFKLPYKQSYRIRRRLLIDFDDIEIFLNHSTIDWIGTTVINTGADRNTGVFTIRGTREATSDTVLSWQNVEYQNQSIIPAPSHLGHANRFSYVTVADGSLYRKGNYVLFEVGNPEDGSNTNYQEVFNPWFKYLVKIIDVSGNNVYLDYYSPFDYSNVNIPSVAKITKVTPRKNVIIHGGTINDDTPYADNESQLNPNRNKLASGIAAMFAVDCRFENITGNRMKFPLVIGTYTNNIKVTNVSNYNVESHGSGEGYAVHLVFSLYCHVKALRHQDGNSALDFSCTSYSTVDNVVCRNVYGGKTLGTHGMTEHDLVFNDCQGHFAFNNGITTFTGISANIVLNRCKGSFFSATGSYLTITMNDCEFLFARTNGRDNFFTKLITNNTILRLQPTTWIYASQRPNQPKTQFIMNGGAIKLTAENAGPIRNAIRGFDEVILSTDIDYTQASGTALAFTNNKSMDISGEIVNTNLLIYYTEHNLTNANINFKGAKFIADNRMATQTDFIKFMTVENIALIVNVLSCTVSNKGTQWAFLHRTDDMTGKTNANITLNVVSSILSKLGEGRLYHYGQGTSNDTSRIVKNTIGNVVNDAQFILGVDFSTNKVSQSEENVGTTSQRPTTNLYVGREYKDTTIRKTITWYGVSWYDEAGTAV